MTFPRPKRLAVWLVALVLALSDRSGVTTRRASAEAMLQYFNTSWNEIAFRMPELAEAGRDSFALMPEQVTSPAAKRR